MRVFVLPAADTYLRACVSVYILACLCVPVCLCVCVCVYSAYDRKKYVWKMLYIYMLGYDVDFGHMEAVGLISAEKYAEKQVGYVVTTVLLNEDHEFLRLVINTMRNDIISNDETFQCLALTAVANLGGKEFAEAMSSDVQKLLVSTTVRPIVRKKAALCLLRLYRKNPDTLNVEEWAEQMSDLLEERHIGVLTAVMTLLLGLVSSDPLGYETCTARVVKVLERVMKGTDVPKDYTYYAIPSPWLQVKTMRVLHYFDPPEDPSVLATLNNVLATILSKSEAVKSVNKNNAVFAILFEAISLVMHLEANKELMGQAVNLLGSFLGVKEPNIRYLALENMGRLSLIPDMMDAIKTHQDKIVESLKDPDISIRRRALDLLYGMCDSDKAKDIVEELLQYLATADFAIREELTLKIAILSERFAADLQWYIDVMLQLIERAGDFVSDDVWYRIVQIVTNNGPLQPYAVKRVVDVMRSPSVHEMMVKVACYILGEFGHTSPEIPPSEMFSLLHDKFASVSTSTKGLLLSSYVKMLSRPAGQQDAKLQSDVQSIFNRHHAYVDCEIQQRAVEYSILAGGGAMASKVLEGMPAFPERESALLRQVEKAEGDAADVSINAARKQSEAMAASHAATTTTTNGQTNGIATQSIGDMLGAGAAVDAGSDLLGGLAGLDMGAPAARAAPADADPFASPAIASEAAPPPPAAPAAATAAAGFGGGADDFFGAPAAPALAAAQPTGSVDEWHRKLLLNDNGILYEDQYIQVGLKCTYSGSSGTLQVFFGNKHSEQITDVVFDVRGSASGAVRASTSSPVTPTLEPRQQVRAQVDVSCSAGFATADAPQLIFSYSIGALRAAPALKLPVMTTKFLSPVQYDAASFFEKWRSIAAPPQKLQTIIVAAREWSGSDAATVFAGCRMAALQGLDPNPSNVVAAGKAESGAIVLARLEADPNNAAKFRLTVASDDAGMSAGVSDVTMVCMDAKPAA